MPIAARNFCMPLRGKRQERLGNVAKMQKSNAEKEKYLLNSRSLDGIITLMKSTGSRAIKPPMLTRRWVNYFLGE